jgi:hypothetical protein
LCAQVAGELHAGGAGDRHLRGTMNREIRRERTNHPADPDVLDDRGIDAGCNDGAEILLRVGNFVGENERVERDIAAHATSVQKLH